MLKKILAAAGLLGCCVGESFAVEPGYPTDYYIYFVDDAATQPAIAVSARGDLALAWAQISPDGTLDIRAEVLPLAGNGYQAQVNTTMAGNQESPSIAADATGNTVVIWRGPGGIFGQRLTVDGQPAGAEFQVTVSPWDASPQVAMDAFGNFVVVWERFDRDVGTAQILARRYLTDGTAPDAEFQVDGPAEGPVGNAAVAMGAWGEFVIAWEQAAPSQPDVFVKSFAADGTPDGAEWLAGALPAQARTGPAVGMDAFGRFVVAWSNKDLGGSLSIQARQYLAGGTPVGDEFAVNVNYPSLWPDAPSVGMGPLGDFVVAWNADYSEVFIKQQFAPDGTRVGQESGDAHRRLPNVSAAMDANGDAYVGYVEPDSSSPRVSRYAGREDIDLGVVVEDLADPISLGQSMSHRVTVTNHHPGRVATGIPEVDSAIGLVNAIASSYVAGPDLTDPQVGDSCRTIDFREMGWSDALLWSCSQALAPGASFTYMVEARVIETGQLEDQTIVYPKHYDSHAANDGVTEITTVFCSDGSQPGTIVVSGPVSVEEGESALVEVQRIGGTCGAVSAGYSSSAGPDTPGSGGILHWADGQDGVQTVLIPTTEDDIDENPQVFDFVLGSTAGGAVLGTPSTTTVTIIDDDDTPTITVTPSEYVVTEGSGDKVTFQLTLSRRTELDVTVPVTAGGSASSSDDYSVDPPDTINFYSGTGAQLDVYYQNDSVVEGDETVVVHFGEPTNAVISGSSSVTVTILDNDGPPSVFIGTADTSVTEGASRFVTLRLSHPSVVDVTVPLLWSGSAVKDADFSAPTSVAIPANAAYVNVPISTLADGLDEDQESAVLTLGTPVNATLGADTNFALSIVDADATPQISFVQAGQVTREGAGVQVTLAAELSGPSSREVKVLLSPSGSAARGTDWSMNGDWLVFPAGSRTATKTVQILNNGVIELDEQVTFSMGSPANAVLGGTTAHTVTIKDNDPELLGVRETVQGAGGP